jgi:hypothetical protein
MKYEVPILRAPSGACLLVCALTFGAMLINHAPTYAVAQMPVPASVGPGVPQAG